MVGKKGKLELVVAMIKDLYVAGEARTLVEKELIENLACTVEHHEKQKQKSIRRLRF